MIRWVEKMEDVEEEQDEWTRSKEKEVMKGRGRGRRAV